MPILVGVAGGTGSGKTTFAERLRERLGPERCLMLAQDAYYKDGRARSAESRAAVNYDHPDAFDLALLVQDLRDLKAGRPVPQLAYDYASDTRKVLPDALTPRPVIILEGILILAHEVTREVRNRQWIEALSALRGSLPPAGARGPPPGVPRDPFLELRGPASVEVIPDSLHLPFY